MKWKWKGLCLTSHACGGRLVGRGVVQDQVHTALGGGVRDALAERQEVRSYHRDQEAAEVLGKTCWAEIIGNAGPYSLASTWRGRVGTTAQCGVGMVRRA